uniref:VWFC domain-containing protein n=1 Tax=Anopheles farauti TaxID=69004 RepID=A0A182Q0M8_9DIPT
MILEPNINQHQEQQQCPANETAKMGPVDKPTNRWPATMLLLLLTASLAQAGPVIRSRRMIREIYVENSAAAPTAPDSTSSDVPSGSGSSNATAASDMCLYDGSYIERSAIACEKKHGCRAIQKTGECCPDYQCECQRDGKTYANGEKVFDPNTPCRACYCQGGEITCSEVSCYKRNDCDPKYIPGRCCPEYDNCPPLENFKITDTSTKDATGGERNDEETNEVKGNYAAEVEDLAGLQKHQTTATTMTTTTTAASVSSGPAISNDNPLGIKIKEITKPEEIRLTDNRPSAEEQQQQQQQQLAAANREASAEHSSSQSEELVNLEHLDVHVPDDDGENGTKIVRHTPDGDGMHSEGENVSDGSASEESAVKTSASAENRLESAESSTVGTVSSTLSESEEWIDIKEFADSSTWSPSSGSSSSTTQAPSLAPSTSGPHEEDVVSESNMKPSKQDNALPAVVQIGDKLVIVDHNQPKPITVIQVEEVEGLQRGEDDTVYDQEMYTERSLSPAAESGRESSKKLKLSHSTEQEQETLSTQADSSGAYETVYHAGSTEQGGGSSEEFYETVFYTEGPESALTSQERNDTDRLQTREPVSVSKEDFLHMGASQEPAKLQQDEEHTTAGASISVTSAEEGSTTLSDLSISLSSEASGDEMIYDTHYYTEEPPGSSSDEHGPTLGTGSAESSTAGYVPRHPVPVADELVPPHATYIEDNEKEFIDPGFQPIPEDFSLPQLDHPAMEMEMDHHPKSAPAKQEKILADVLMELKRNSTTATTTTTTTTDHPNTASSTESSTTEGFSASQEAASNSPSWLKEEPRPQLRSPGEPLLIPEWERVNGTQGSSNSSSEEQLENEASGAGTSPGDFQMLKMGSEEYVDAGEGSGQQSVGSTPASQPSKAIENRSEEEEDDETSGKGELAGSAEASTSTKPLLDIDSPANVTADEQSDSVKHNPKNDVESLKYDEDENNATAEEAIPKKVQQLEPAGERDGTPTLTGV